jgi:hypothetical protein
MAITPSWVTSTEATEVEETYIDKGAVMTPQINPVTDARYAAGKAQAAAMDKVEWPTKVAGQTDQGM